VNSVAHKANFRASAKYCSIKRKNIMHYPFLIHEFLEKSASESPNKSAIIFQGKHVKYAQINHWSDLFAISLINLGLQRGDRIAILLKNSPEVIISFYGALKAGGIFIIPNNQIKNQKLKHIINNSAAKILITSSDFQGVVDKTIQELNTPIRIIWTDKESLLKDGDSSNSYLFQSLINVSLNQCLAKRELEKTVPRIIDRDCATIIYTSGTTNAPKGVICTHFNVVSAAKSIINYLGNTKEDVILCTLPLSFDYGLYQVIMTLMFGGTIVLDSNFVLIADVVRQIEREMVTGFPIVPMMLTMMLNTIDLSQYNFTSLKYITSTGDSLNTNQINKFRNLYPEVKFFSMYGLTECKRVSFLDPKEIDKRPLSVGKPIPNCEVSILDNYGHPVENGKVGELVVRGSNVMQGYWNDIQLTKSKFQRESVSNEILLYTGDYFNYDNEGFLYFQGRKDDLIKSRGERISPKEIERIIYQINGVLECIVFGEPDSFLGQRIKAVIVKDKNSKLTSSRIFDYCKENLEKCAIPQEIVFVESIPRTPHGKINKSKLAKS
jgi:long-chain acyl-CoA synthetase